MPGEVCRWPVRCCTSFTWGHSPRAGTFDAAAAQLPILKDLGITTIELMPVAEFPGRFNWGYDGVQLFAPYHGYGDPDALRRFVDRAHACGLAVVLDVVYNHFGPDGNYLHEYSPSYFTSRYQNEWGEAINFDGEQSEGVRAFFRENVRYWIEDFHLDGLRLDATQSIHDSGRPHILSELVDVARRAAGRRTVVISAENEPQNSTALRLPSEGGHGIDALWNDDFHHTARVAATGRRDGYFRDYRGTPQEFISAARRGFLFQGQHYAWQGKRRGVPTESAAAASFITFLQNHDQVANTLQGRRLTDLACAARLRALTAVWLLSPGTPLFFMGQEFGASNPFPFFADHQPELAAKVWAGRREFLAQFDAYKPAASQLLVPDPASESTFESARLEFADGISQSPWYRLHQDLLRIRRTDALIRRQDRQTIDGAVLGRDCFVLRWFSDDRTEGDRLMLVNLGVDEELTVVPEPLLAPQLGHEWQPVWSSEDPAYGGMGDAPVYADARWCAPAERATLFIARPGMKESA